MKPAVPMEHDPEVFVRDIKELHKQREKAKEDLQKLVVEFERKERSLELKYESKSVALSRTLRELNSSKKLLEKEEEVLQKQIFLKGKELKSLTLAHEDLSRQMTGEKKKKQDEIDLLSAQSLSLAEHISSLSRKIRELLSEVSLLESNRKDVSAELERGVNKLRTLEEDIGISEKHLLTLRSKAEQFRTDVLEVNEQKKELGMKLHDVRILETRLEPEFKKVMQEYLKTHRYAILD